MGDWKKDLADQFQIGTEKQLNQKKAKRDQTTKRTSQHNIVRPHINPSDLALARLTTLGQVLNYNPDRGFGHIAMGPFFHISNEISNTKSIKNINTNLKQILYIVGSRPNDDRPIAAQWCFAEDITWPGGVVPKIQDDFNKIRRMSLMAQPLESIIELLKTEWIQENRNLDNARTNLIDPVLAEVFVKKISIASPDELKFYNLIEVLSGSRYGFARGFVRNVDDFVPADLLEQLTPLQLVIFGSPRYQWNYRSTRNYTPKMLEWALRSPIEDDQKAKWESLLDAQITYQIAVACNLLETPDWVATQTARLWIKRLLESGQIRPTKVVQRLQYFPEEWKDWAEYLSPEEEKVFLEGQLKEFGTRPGSLDFESNPNFIRLLLLERTLAIDIESDAERIWEIGVAGRVDKRLLFSREDPDGHLGSALHELETSLRQTALVVGHNLLAWDWPILKTRLSLNRTPIIWDTMLVQFLLEPWSSSHALGSNHRADDDAAESLSLFQQQVETLGGDLAVRIINGEFQSTQELTLAISDRFRHCDWRIPSSPEELSMDAIRTKQDRVVVLPRERIAGFSWLPNTDLITVCDSESLNELDRTICFEDLRTALRSSGSDLPIGVVLLGVLTKAKDYQISVRFGMMPWWVRENENIKSLLRSALAHPKPNPGSLRLAEYPKQPDWYSNIDFESHIFLNPPPCAFLVNDQWIRGEQLSSSIQLTLLGNNSPRNGALFRCNNKSSSLTTQWIVLDPASRALSKGGNCWHSISTAEFPTTDQLTIHRTERPPRSQPWLLIRGDTVLFPGAEDQSAYWRDVLLTVQSISSENPPGAVSILLVGSSISRDLVCLLEEGLAELGLAEVHKSHHSRRERLARASRKGLGCVVDVISSWPNWKEAGNSSCVSLIPIIESLPIYEWYATSSMKSNKTETLDIEPGEVDDPEKEGDESLDQPNDPAIHQPVRQDEECELVPGSKVIASIEELLELNLNEWLWSMDLADHTPAPIAIDPRLNPNLKRVQKILNVKRMKLLEADPNQIEMLERAFEAIQIKRESAPSDYESMRSFLEIHWNIGKHKHDPEGISDFRELTQRPAIDAIRERHSDVLVTLPTGEGKSVLFQVPALCKGLRTRRLSLVISPLRALMRDQVERLWSQGFHQSVDYITADRPIHEIEDVFQRILDHQIVLLYVAPERFRSRRFIDLLNRRFQSDGSFEYLVVDETHCVSQWGYEFRPDYFYALDTICFNYRQAENLDKTPFLLLSATVTASSRDHLSSLIKGATNQDPDNRYLPFVSTPGEYFHPIRSHISIHPKQVNGRISRRPDSEWPIEPRLDEIVANVKAAQQNIEHTGQSSAVIVFVARRDHAEELASMLQKVTKRRVDFFHAGLGSETRQEVYERFKDGEIDVLVATKAFGMGMDIPHIHWAIHLSPPTFLEDFLQEVGRIGRGEKHRKAAALVQLKAVLLYSTDDFEANRTNIIRSRIEFPQLLDLYTNLYGASKEADGNMLAIMPDAGFEQNESAASRRSACTQVRKQLYWLERLNRISILAMLPSLLPLRLNIDRLRQIGSEDTSPISEVATALAAIGSSPLSSKLTQKDQLNKREPIGKGILDRIVDGLNKFVGFIFSPSRPNPTPLEENTRPPIAQSQPTCDAIINLAQVCRMTSVAHLDDVLSIISELEALSAVGVSRKIAFGLGRYSRLDPEHIKFLFTVFWGTVDKVLGTLLHEPQYVIDFDELGEGLPEFRIDDDLIDVRPSLEKALCYVLRACGVRTREILKEDNRRIITASLSQSKYWMARDSAMEVRKSSDDLWKVFRDKILAKERDIEISTLLSVIKEHSKLKRYREAELRRVLGLLGSLKLIYVSEPLVPMSYVISLGEKSSPLSVDENEDVWSELTSVNRLTELRGEAFEIFVHLPDEMRNGFIESYFSQSNPDGMERFLNEQLSQIDEQGSEELGDFVQEKLSHLRASAVDEFFKPFTKEPQEPNQWLVVSHPYNQHLLVNAGPGSGKTSVLIARIAHLIQKQHLRPEDILVLAFNRAVVFEIRSRIRALFDRLGYGAYVRRIKVYTFHSFALQHLNSRLNTDNWDQDRTTLLETFASRLESDSRFLSDVAGGLRAILVDEFQDVNQDLLRIIRSLFSGSGNMAGVMVIGDDDQDILRWNRAGGESSETYFSEFKKTFSIQEKDQLTLRVNFRSGESIVNESQCFLSEFFIRTNGAARRMKVDMLVPSNSAPEASVQPSLVPNWASNSVLKTLSPILNSVGTPDSLKSTAILCRTNHEVATLHTQLYEHFRNVEIQNNVNYPISKLRHLGIWLDLLKAEIRNTERPLLSENTYNRLLSCYSKLPIPEVTSPRHDDLHPRLFWDLCLKERSYPYLSHLIDLMENLDSDDLSRLAGTSEEKTPRTVISTIHKVKGLEFDRVIILPSLAGFPLRSGNTSQQSNQRLVQDAAEEARLFYVAMTRAKSDLYFFFGPRENAWTSTIPFQGSNGSGKVLAGKLDEIGISWSWESTAWNQDASITQKYIERHVRVGDQLQLGGSGAGAGLSIFHCADGNTRRQQIGRLSKQSGPGGSQANLRVSAVLRCNYGESHFGGTPAKEVLQRGWGLVVAATGVLR